MILILGSEGVKFHERKLSIYSIDLEKNTAKGVNVSRSSPRFVSSNFRSTVFVCSTFDAVCNARRCIGSISTQSEVSNEKSVIAIEEDISWFEILVSDIIIVEILHRFRKTSINTTQPFFRMEKVVRYVQTFA